MTESFEKWPDLAGRIEGRRHILPVRVYFEDTDFSGLVYHANFLKFIERGRSDFIRLLGIHHHELERGLGLSEGAPSFFVVRHMELDYLRPAQIDDLLEVVTWLDQLGRASMTLIQEVRRDERVIFRAKVVVVLISKAGKPQRMGELMRQALSPVMPAGEDD